MQSHPHTIMKIYRGFKDQARKEGFADDAFWTKVCYFTDPQNSDAESWALAGQAALRSLREERSMSL